MDNPQIDLLAVLIAAIISTVLGALWYSKWLFCPAWKRLSQLQPHHGKLPILWNFLATLLTAYMLGFFMVFLGITTVSDGVFVGFLAWFGFAATTRIGGVIWAKQPFQLFLIDGGFQLLSYLVMGGILGA